jgi:hypothetical protein
MTDSKYYPAPLGLHTQAQTGSLGTAATTGLLYQPQMIGDGDCREIG